MDQLVYNFFGIELFWECLQMIWLKDFEGDDGINIKYQREPGLWLVVFRLCEVEN